MLRDGLCYGMLLCLLWSQIGHATQLATDLDQCPPPTRFPPSIPERCCNTCPGAPQLWTMPEQPSFAQTKIAFVNKMEEPARLRWVDSNGVEHDSDLVPPGSTVNALTYEGHVTRAYSEKDGRLLVEHMAGRRVLGSDAQVNMTKLANHLLGKKASVNLVQMNKKPKGKFFRETATKGKPGPENYPAYGFANMLSVAVRLYFRQGGHEYQIYELKPGETYYESTYPGHEWLARTRDGQLLTEFRVAAVPITDCAKHEDSQGLQLAAHGAALMAEGVGDWLKASASSLLQEPHRKLRGLRKSGLDGEGVEV